MKKNDYNCWIIEDLRDLAKVEEMLLNKYKTLDQIYFRGQANKEWELLPRALRKKDMKDLHEPKTTSHICEEMFLEIAKYQHYDIDVQTRFLDFTKDFFISLFFACEDVSKNNNSFDGCVYAVWYDARNESCIDLKLICELTQIKENVTIQEFADLFCTEDHDNEEIVLRLASFLDYGFMVEPSQMCYEAIKDSNPRMYAQKGCFYIPGNKTDRPLSEGFNQTSNYARYLEIMPEISSVTPYLTDEIFNYKFIIPFQIKKDILEYIDQKYGINKHTLFLDD